jgi:hypothetical protein
MSTSNQAYVPWLTLMLALFAACGDDPATPPPGGDQPDPPIGATSFVSAAGDWYQGDDRGNDVEAGEPGGSGGEERTVEEGDIYRVLGEGLVVNLNSYRGLQVIDLSRPEAPRIVGALRLSGTPVEAYVVDDVAVVLLNNWRGYYGSTLPTSLETHSGGLVVLVDLSDPEAPAILDHETILGSIMTSRLTRSAEANALYVAASLWQYGGEGVAVGGGSTSVDASSAETVVVSYTVGPTSLARAGSIELGGWISDIQATPEALLVARYDWEAGAGSAVSVIDISDPSGAMVAGAEVTTSGTVTSQFNMDLYRGVLRVVSDGSWSEGDTNHLETWDVTDIEAPRLVDHETFGAEQQLYATLFLGNKAFFVTYMRVDPFHAFAIDDAGDATEMAEFVVSGWNDFFRAAFGEERLLGVGINDEEQARTLAVSLYDITDLSAAEPLLARAEVDLEESWSEANWDHRAFTVLEDAVEVEAPGGGTTETGLILLPFNGWDDDGYLAGAQIFTFSRDTLTARGVMRHETPVRRSFLAEDDVCANLSEVALSTFDTSDPDEPVALGELVLAPSYSDLLRFGAYGARVESTTDYDWYSGRDQIEPWAVEVVDLADDPDTATPLATFEVPAGAGLFQVGELLVAVATTYDWAAGDAGTWHTTMDVFDLADPTAPAFMGRVETEELTPSEGYYGGGWPEPAVDCWDCGWGYGYSAVVGHALGEALVLVGAEWRSEIAGVREVCVVSPPSQSGGGSEPTDPVDPVEPTEPGEPGGAGDEVGVGDEEEPGETGDGDTYLTGRIECVSENGGEPVCYGQIYECTGFEEDCVAVDPETIEVERECTSSPYERRWRQPRLHALDLREPASPTLAAPFDVPDGDDGVTTLADGTDLWVSFRLPTQVAGDSRPYFRYYARRVGFADPTAPELGAGINVPGVLLAVSGTSAYTQDFVYADEGVESALSRVTLSDTTAVLRARHRFVDRQVQGMLLDGAGNALVSHGPAWYGWDDVASDTDAYLHRLSVLDANDLGTVAELALDSWAELRGALPGRALFQVPGGLLVTNLDEPSAPYPQAYFASLGWPRQVLFHERDVMFAAGRYGIYRFGIDEHNLLTTAE